MQRTTGQQTMLQLSVTRGVVTSLLSSCYPSKPPHVQSLLKLYVCIGQTLESV